MEALRDEPSVTLIVTMSPGSPFTIRPHTAPHRLLYRSWMRATLPSVGSQVTASAAQPSLLGLLPSQPAPGQGGGGSSKSLGSWSAATVASAPTTAVTTPT